MGVHSKTKADMSSSSSSNHSFNSLSFSGFVTSKDPQPIKSSDKKIKARDQGFEFGLSVGDRYGGESFVLPRPRQKQGQVSCKRRLENGGQRPLVVRNNSIRRGGRRIREEEDESSWSGWSVFRSFVSPCRECRATKPAVVEARPVQRA